MKNKLTVTPSTEKKNDADSCETWEGRGMKNILTPTLLVVALFTISIMLTACKSGTNLIVWQEEVQLKNGDIITVKRTAKSKSFGEIGGPGGWENEGMTLIIEKPKKPDDPPLWDFPFVPVVFDRDEITKDWFVVATFYSCQSWYDLGRPKLPYAEYRVRNGQWQKVELSPSVMGLMANMLTGIRSGGEPPLIDMTAKRNRMSDTRIAKEYSQVVSTWSTGC